MTENNFLSSFNNKIKKKLYLKEFWDSEPCYWTITNYLSKLISQDPAVGRRSASNRIVNDATLIKDHVVAGTVAETMANSMLSFPRRSRAKKTFNSFFDRHASQMSQESLKYAFQKTRLRSSMAEQVANQEEKENATKRPFSEVGSSRRTKPRKMKEIELINDNQTTEEGPSHRTRSSTMNSNTMMDNQIREQGVDNDQEDKEDEKVNIWIEWKDFLESQENKRQFMELSILSPEMHNVIWCGKLVRRRNCLPMELYDKLNQEIPLVSMQDINPCLIPMSMDIFDAESNSEMQSCIERLNSFVLKEPILVAERKLVVDFCRTLNDYIFDDYGLKVIQTSESCYRSYLFDNCLKASAKYLRSTNNNVIFFPGEIELDAMTTQLKQKGINDRRYKYNADGIFRSNDFSEIEILLAEVSLAYGASDAGKVSFDHYKAMFGMMAMIRRVAQLYDKASFNTFAKLKIHFLHAHGDAIRHWTMSTPAPGIYIMNKEQRVCVPVSFSEKDITIHPFICFFKTLAIACEETLSVLKELKKDHKTRLRSKNKQQKLCSVINPVVVRLNEGKHTTIVADHGPMSLPSSPMHD